MSEPREKEMGVAFESPLLREVAVREDEKDFNLSIQLFPKSLHHILEEVDREFGGDDSYDGMLDTEELTQMVTMYRDMKLAQKNGVIVIDAMPAEMQPSLRIFDMLGDGQVAPMELARGAELYQLSKDKAKLMGRIAMVLSVVLVALVVAIGFMTAFVVEQSKETNTGVDGITKVAGGTQIAAAASVEQQDGFAAAFDWKPQQLDRVKSLYFPEDPTVTCATDVYCEDGTELSYTVTGWSRNTEAGLTFYTARGDTVNVKKTGVTIKDSAGATLLSRTAGTSGRRQLQFGGTFGGALLTSGSFTMMAASGGF